MKKFLLLLLVGAMLLGSCVALASCGGETVVNEHVAVDENGDGKCDVCGENMPVVIPDTLVSYAEFVAGSRSHTPAKVTTAVNYKYGDDNLKGKYTTLTGEDFLVFTYEYDRYATVEEMADSRIVRTCGTIYYKDGRIVATDGEEPNENSEWSSVTPAGINVGLALEKCQSVATFNESHSVITATLSGEMIADVLGTDLGATGDVLLSVTVNNTYLNNVKIEYATERGANVLVETSYTYDTNESADVGLEVAVASVAALCRVSNPTKISTVATQKTGIITQISSGVLTRGTIDGENAATYVKTVQELTDAANPKVSTPISTSVTKYEYVESKGVRINGGEWVEDSIDIAPAAGFLRFNLIGNYQNASYANGVLSFIVPQDKVSAALSTFLEGKEIHSDVKVSISNAGGVIIGITLEYVIEADESDINQNDIEVTIEATYSYDLEEITID